MDEVLQVAGMGHRDGSTTVLDGVDLTVGAGECVALLGPNGAGTSTLIGPATGLLARQDGTVRVCGVSLPEVSAWSTVQRSSIMACTVRQ